MKNRRTVRMQIGTLAVLTALAWGSSPVQADGYSHHRHRGHYNAYRHRGHHQGHGYDHRPYQYHGDHYRRGPSSEISFQYDTPIYTHRTVPGHYEIHIERVEVNPGYFKKRWVPPLRETRQDANGESYDIEVRKGYWEKVWVAPKYVEREVKTWVPATKQIVTYPSPRISVGGTVRF